MSTNWLSDTDSGGFQPIDPWKSEELALRRRNLPPLGVPGATYFITFRSKIELPLEARDLVIAAIQACDRKSIDLDAAVVMPDHVHLIFRLIDSYELSEVLQRIKGGSARRINQILKREGALWRDESFEHIIRHAEELDEQIDYIRQNPVKQALVDGSETYRWLFVKSTTG